MGKITTIGNIGKSFFANIGIIFLMTWFPVKTILDILIYRFPIHGDYRNNEMFPTQFNWLLCLVVGDYFPLLYILFIYVNFCWKRWKHSVQSNNQTFKQRLKSRFLVGGRLDKISLIGKNGHHIVDLDDSAIVYCCSKVFMLNNKVPSILLSKIFFETL